MVGGRGAGDGGSDGLGRALGVAVAQEQVRREVAPVRALVARGLRLGEVGAGGLVVAEAQQRAQLPLALGQCQEMGRAQLVGQALAVAPGVVRVRPAAVGVREHRVAVALGDGRCRLGALVEQRGGAQEHGLALVVAAALDGDRAERHRGHAGERMRRPADAVGDRQCLAQQLLGAIELLAHVGDRAERGQAADLQVGPAQAPAEHEAALEVLLGLGEAPGPGLGDAEVQQREGLELGVGRLGVLVVGAAQHARRALHRRAHVAQAAGAQELHGGQRGVGAAPALRGHVGQRALGGGQQPVGLRPARLAQAVAGHDRGQLGVGGDERLGHRVEQRAEPRLLAVEDETDPVAPEQLGGQRPILAELGVVDGLDHMALIGVPARREAVQLGDLAGRLAAQLEPQQIAEQVVVAKPRATDVDRDHERVGLLELVQEAGGVVAAGEQVGQRPAHAVQHAGAQQQAAHLGRPAGEDLAEQVVGDGALAAGELGDEALGRVVADERHGGQAQRGGPALGALVQRGELGVADGHAGGGQQLGGLVGGEAEVGAADLGEAAGQAQAVQAELRVATADDDRAQLGGRAGDEPLEAGHGVVGAQLVQVVEDEDHRRGQALEALGEALDELVRGAQRRRDERRERVALGDRAAVAQGGDDERPEAARVGRVALDVDPGDAGAVGQIAALQPRGDEHRLAAAGRPADQRERARGALVEQREEPRALDDLVGGRHATSGWIIQAFGSQ